jgi:hypothetical protein
MIKIFSPFMLLLFSVAYAQKATFKEIRFKPDPRLFNSKEATIIYPIIVTTNPEADELMNAQIKEEMFSPGDDKRSTRNILHEQLSMDGLGLINLSYKVTHNTNGVLSMYIYAEGCGAHCSSWNSYFNFYLQTGKEINITDMIAEDKIDSFTNIVLHDKLKALQRYKTEEITELKADHIDSVSYILEQVDSNCAKSVAIGNFSLSNQMIGIIDPCEFPFMLRSQEPSYELKYAYKFLQPFLKPKFKIILNH